MKTKAELWTPNHGDLISPCSTLQTLCENQSGSFAVQSAPDFQNHTFSLLKRQPQKFRAWLSRNLHLSNEKLCAKLGIQRIDFWLSKFALQRTPEQRLAIAREQNSGSNNPRWKGGISKNHYHWKKLQRERYPERVNARQAVHRAVKSGKLVPLPCQHPGCNETRTYAHHHDYSKPLEVTWFCRPHHAEADGPRKITRACDGCGDRFYPEGKATICETCERNGFFRRTCSVCGTPFDTRDLGRWKCCFCGDGEDHEIYAQSRPLYEIL